MKQSAAVRPDPTPQRKAAIARGAALEHNGGRVRVAPIPHFDLNRTIFKTLEGAAPRFVMNTRVGIEAHWDAAAAQAVQAEYEATGAARKLPPIDPALMQFLLTECDFDVEHADGSFLDHLYFCFEYCVQHYPGHDPLVLFLHSILGTSTNTFAMPAGKIPALRPLMSPEVWTQVEAFPSVLRLLLVGPLRRELEANAHRADAIQSVRFHRVIDNAPITMGGADFWVGLNYQLIHMVDFLPVANWSAHQNDSTFILFRHLYDLLKKAGKLEAKVGYTPASGERSLAGETSGVGNWLVSRIPVGLAEKMASKSVARFSQRIGHSLDYTITWA